MPDAHSFILLNYIKKTICSFNLHVFQFIHWRRIQSQKIFGLFLLNLKENSRMYPFEIFNLPN